MLAKFPRLTLVMILFASVAVSQETRPETRSKIVDDVGLFGRAAVEAGVKALEKTERETGVPVVIEVVASLRGEPIEEAAQKEAAKLPGFSGVFVLIARDDHKLYTLTRRQLDTRLPVARKQAITDTFTASFKDRKFDEGLANGIAEIAAILKSTAGEPLVERNRVRLTLAGARKALAAAEAKAAEMKLKANIAVVDDGGHLIVFARMEGARPASAPTAQTKAISAATMRQATGPLPPGAATPDLIVNLGLAGAAASGGGRVTTLYGGVPIVIDGQVVGAVGVGGGSGEQDAEVARAGVAAVEGESKKTAKE